jgi:hypothetical protein
LFAALPSVFIIKILPFLLNIADANFEVEMQYVSESKKLLKSSF